jgi:hypothetical protein
VRSRKTGDIICLIKEWEIQGGAISEVGINWGTYPSSANLASWFREDIQDMCMHTAHNKHKGVVHQQPGGIATFACMELVRYHKQKGDNFCSLGGWCLTAFYADPSHCTCIISAYNVGRHAPRGDSMIYQQQLRYIQNHGLDSTPSRLFTVDFVTQLQVWQCQGDRLLVFMDMNKHILTSHVARRLLTMSLRKAMHSQWGETEPHTYVRGLELINAVWYSQDLEVISTLQLSFHKGVGDHCLVLVDITAQLAIGKQEFKVVHPHGRCLSSQNNGARIRYLRHLETQMRTHRMVKRLSACEQRMFTYPALADAIKDMQTMDMQMAEMQRGSKRQCRIIYSTEMPFSKPVRTVHFRWRAYQGLVKLLDSMTRKSSNLFREAIKAGIPAPRLLTRDQCLDGVEACTRRLKVLKAQSGGLRKLHLRDCLIKAQEDGDKARSKGILCTIKREEQKSVWQRINRAIDDPSLGAIPLV